jgi:hypothetical protein
MDSMFNTSSYGNPFMGAGMMYGGNFVDVLLRHIMENGWQGISFIAFINFYIYLSLDKIKDLFKHSNDLIGVYGKKYGEKIGSKFLDFVKYYFLFLFTLVSKTCFDKFKKKIPEIFTVANTNKVTIKISHKNIIDLMAIGSYLLKYKDRVNLYNKNRINSDKYKIIETYTLPNLINLENELLRETIPELKHTEDLTMYLYQNVYATLVCESDSHVEILKNVNIKVTENKKNTITLSTFQDILIPFSIGQWDFLMFAYKKNDYDQRCINLKCREVLIYIHYTKNNELFKKFYESLNGKIYFEFGNAEYKFSTEFSYLPSLEKPENMEIYLNELNDYCDKKLIPYCNSLGIRFVQWLSRMKDMIETSDNDFSFNICVESNTIEQNKLSEYATKTMNYLIDQYYHQNCENIGNKISIYQLYIDYETEILKKENPKYIEWMKYNDNEMNDSLNTDIKENSNSDDVNKPKDRQDQNGNSSQIKMVPNMIYPQKCNDHVRKNKPEQFIDEQIKKPISESRHIKTDKKPMAHLYLPKDEKNLLVNYLSNYKNNRDKYDQFGITYKGGVLLSGEPGCGKSSTIVAMATYLGKDIYYMDLAHIKTNHELKLCVDHVSINSQNGGIIIFEDIDCMSEIVKCRNYNNFNSIVEEISQESTSITKNMNTENDALSLSFLLNILDGTMAPEDVIFVITTNHPEVLDRALIRPGRMDISINIKKCCREQLKDIYYDLFGVELNDSVINRFKEYNFITAEIIMYLFHNTYKDVDPEILLKKFLD